MEFKTTAWRVVNRDGKRYTANAEWIIIADNNDIAKIFKAYWFEEIKPKKTTNESNKKTNKKVWE